MSVFQFVKSRSFWIHLGLGFLSIVLFLYIFIKVLGASTHHGESLDMPDLKGVTMSSAIIILEEKGLKYELLDTVFLTDKPRGTIIEQIPQAGSKIKGDRIVYLTLNAAFAPKVSMPTYHDRLKAEVLVDMTNLGLILGKVSFKADVADGLVLDALYKGRNIKEGTPIEKGSVIDLVVGRTNGFEEEDQVVIPDLIGLTYSEARQLLRASELEVGSAVFQKNTSDSSEAVVYKQYPEQGKTAPRGTSIDFHLKNP